jgi:hypothetical protein
MARHPYAIPNRERPDPEFAIRALSGARDSHDSSGYCEGSASKAGSSVDKRLKCRLSHQLRDGLDSWYEQRDYCDNACFQVHRPESLQADGLAPLQKRRYRAFCTRLTIRFPKIVDPLELFTDLTFCPNTALKQHFVQGDTEGNKEDNRC